MSRATWRFEGRFSVNNATSCLGSCHIKRPNNCFWLPCLMQTGKGWGGMPGEWQVDDQHALATPNQTTPTTCSHPASLFKPTNYVSRTSICSVNIYRHVLCVRSAFFMRPPHMRFGGDAPRHATPRISHLQQSYQPVPAYMCTQPNDSSCDTQSFDDTNSHNSNNLTSTILS